MKIMMFGIMKMFETWIMMVKPVDVIPFMLMMFSELVLLFVLFRLDLMEDSIS